MKIVQPTAFAVASLAATTIDPAGGSNGVGAYYEDSTCTKTLLANIDGGACQDDSGCKPTGISMFCIDDAAEYLKTAFGDSRYVVAETYSDAECTQLLLTRAFLADGECHVGHEDDGRAWSMTTTVSGDGTVAVLGTDDQCDGPDPFYHQDPVPKSDINTDECVVIPDSDGGGESYGAKFYLFDPSTPTPASASDSLDPSTDDGGSSTSNADPSGLSTNDTTSGSSTDGATNTTDATATPTATKATTGSTSEASNLLAVSLVLIYASVAIAAAVV